MYLFMTIILFTNQSIVFSDGRVEKVRVEGEAVIGFAVDSEVLEFVGKAFRQERHGHALGRNDHLADMLLAILLDLVAHTMVRLFVSNDVKAHHPPQNTLELFPTRFLPFRRSLFYKISYDVIRFFLISSVCCQSLQGLRYRVLGSSS
jgi:hypothetical protein